MKKLLIAICLIFFATTSFSQRLVEKSIEVKNQKNVILDFDFADEIKIKGWDKDQILVKVSVSINENEDNDAFLLEARELGSSIRFISEIENMKKISKNRVIVKKSKDGKRITTYSNNWQIDMDIYFEVFLPRNLDINLSTISGDVILTNIGGELNLETISGFIDLKIERNARASVKTSTISGGVYTDHEIELIRKMKGSKYHLVAGRSPDFKLNGGGREIKLETISGNIYIRK